MVAILSLDPFCVVFLSAELEHDTEPSVRAEQSLGSCITDRRLEERSRVNSHDGLSIYGEDPVQGRVGARQDTVHMGAGQTIEG
jgi:hypothetical protein